MKQRARINSNYRSAGLRENAATAEQLICRCVGRDRLETENLFTKTAGKNQMAYNSRLGLDETYYSTIIENIDEAREFASQASEKHSHLAEKHLKNCRLIENRFKLLELMPKNAVCAEIGVMHGNFSQEILCRSEPKKLYLFEINERLMANVKNRFSDEISQGRVEWCLGDSVKTLSIFHDNFFDWVFIDSSHTYDQTKKELDVIKSKVKEDGLIAMHDYLAYADDDEEYGVVQAVNEFCNLYDYEVIYLTLEWHMYNAVVLRKL